MIKINISTLGLILQQFTSVYNIFLRSNNKSIRETIIL